MRDRLTWFSYLLYGLWSFVWCTYAPVMPFLRAEMKLSYAEASLHFSGLALGLLIAGCTGFQILKRIPRQTAVWWGSIAICVAAFTLALPAHSAITIAGAVVVGFAGSIAAQSFFSTLAERQPQHRAVTIAELTITNSLFAAATPLVVAAFVNAHLPWRALSVLPIVLFLLIAFGTKGGGTATSTSASAQSQAGGKLTRAYWLYFAIVFLTTAAEWSVSFWCPEYLKNVHHFSPVAACHSLSLFLLSMLVGRAATVKLTQLFRTENLLATTIVLATCGFFLFWCGTTPLVVNAGLILLGLGQANCYPLALSAALASAPNNTTEATSKMSISTGAAIFFAPFLLGLCADHFGIAQSYGIVAALLIASAIAALKPLPTASPQR